MADSNSEPDDNAASASIVSTTETSPIYAQERHFSLTSDVSFPDASRLTQALDKHRAEFEAIPEHELVRVRFDILATAMMLLKYLEAWRALLPRIRRLPESDLHLIENLETLIEAMIAAQNEYTTASTVPAQAVEALAEADALRTMLKGDAEGLERRGHLPPGSLKNVRGRPGYRNTAAELGALCQLLRKYLPGFRDKTSITEEELNRGSVLAQIILRTASNRDQGNPNTVAAIHLRRQSVTLVTRAWEEYRRAVLYLEPAPGELERIAPSLYAGSGRRSSTGASDAGDESEFDEDGLGADALDDDLASAAAEVTGDQTSGATPAGNLDAIQAQANDPNALPSDDPFVK